MKLGFFHDTKIIKGINNEWYSARFTYNIWKRYTKVFDNFIVCTRVIEESEKNIEKEKLASGKNIKFLPIDKYNSSKDLIISWRDINKQIHEICKSIDGAIVRMPSIIGLLACKELYRLNKPYIIEVVGCGFESNWYHGSILGKLSAPIVYIMNKKYINKANGCIYITDNFLQNRYPCKGSSFDGISNVSIDLKKSNLVKEKVRSINLDKIINIGMIGSLDVNYKGHKVALKMAKELKKRNIKFKLKFLGEGNSSRWEKFAKNMDVIDSVSFDGVLANGEKVDKWLDNIDIYIQPSYTEGHGRSIVEAVSRGCLVFATEVGGIPDSLISECTFRKGDHLELANKINEVIIDISKFKELIELNYEKCKKFDINIIEKKREEALNWFKLYIGNRGK